MARVIIEVTDEQHQHIKALAALQGKSMKDYALERLLDPTPDEEKALEELRGMLMARLQGGTLSMKSVDDIVAEELSGGAAA